MSDKNSHRYESIDYYIREIKEYYNDNKSLTDFEIIDLAIKMQKNNLIREAFGVPFLQNKPTYLEEIMVKIEDIAKSI